MKYIFTVLLWWQLFSSLKNWAIILFLQNKGHVTFQSTKPVKLPVVSNHCITNISFPWYQELLILNYIKNLNKLYAAICLSLLYTNSSSKDISWNLSTITVKIRFVRPSLPLHQFIYFSSHYLYFLTGTSLWQ